MFYLLSVLILICSVLLVFIVLVQNSKGGGLASGFASSNQVLGVRKTTDFLEKATWTVAVTVMVLCIAVTATIPRGKAEAGSEVLDNISAPVNTAAPDFGSAQPDAQQGLQLPVQPLELPQE